MSDRGADDEDGATAEVVEREMRARRSEYTTRKELSVFCGTWNVNGRKPGDLSNLSQWLGRDKVGPATRHPDLFVLGFQELDNSGWALLLGDTSQAMPWEEALHSALPKRGAEYDLVAVQQLVGMMVVVYAKKGLPIRRVGTAVCPTGFMGVMGNKGAVAARFEVADTSLCVINSHLTPHVGNLERRNSDFRNVAAQRPGGLVFCSGAHPDGMDESAVTPMEGIPQTMEHDVVMWFGDLNYRLAGEDGRIREMLKRGSPQVWKEMLESMDELKAQMRTPGGAFCSFREAEIEWAPTFKYNMKEDVEEYESGEGARTPSWCDRVVWKDSSSDHQGVKCVWYSREELKGSDHRPVTSIFSVRCEAIVPSKMNSVKKAVLRKLDSLRNAALPDVSLAPRAVDLGLVRFLRPSQPALLTMQNVGPSELRWKLTGVRQPWLSITPTSGSLARGETATLSARAELVTPENLWSLLASLQDRKPNSQGQISLDDIVIVHLIGGKDLFVSISASTDPNTRFGRTLAQLRQFSKPGSVPEQQPPAVPGDLASLVEFLRGRGGLSDRSLFLRPGDPSSVTRVMDALDAGAAIPQDVDIQSVAETMLRLLESMPKSLFPPEWYPKCLEAAPAGPAECARVVQSCLSTQDQAVFNYIVEFLRDLLQQSNADEQDAHNLATLFSSLLLRRPKVPPAQQAVSPALSQQQQQQNTKRRVLFIKHFLTPALISDSDQGKSLLLGSAL